MDKFGFEKEVIDLTKKILNEYNNKISEQKLRFELIGPKTVSNGPESHTSEIEILFFRNESIVDILEFFVFRNGKKIADLEKIKEWLHNSLEDVLNKN